MSTDFPEVSKEGKPSDNNIFQQEIKGSRQASNYVVGGMLTIGGIGFLLAAFSSYLGKDLLPLGNPSTLIFVPQGLVMGLYGIAASLLALYLWRLIAVDFGSGINCFDKNAGILFVSRQGLFKEINIEIPLQEIKAVKLDAREGFNSRRRICLRIQGKKDLPISKVGSPPPLLELEEEGAELARFLDISLEGLS